MSVAALTHWAKMRQSNLRSEGRMTQPESALATQLACRSGLRRRENLLEDDSNGN